MDIKNEQPVTSDLETEIVTELHRMLAAGETIDVFQTALQLDLNHNMKRVRDLLVSGGHCTKPEWTRACKMSKIRSELGFMPVDVVDFVDRYAQRERIGINYQKQMRRMAEPTFEGQPISQNDRADPAIDAVARIVENREINVDTLCRDLRLIADKYDLRYSAQSISDAVSHLFDEKLENRVLEVYYQIAQTRPDAGKALEFTREWDKVVSQFDTTEQTPEFVIAVLKKFIWQVKRKMLGLPIYNHLMPVIIGPQGVGKSTFVRNKLLEPVDELTGNTDFKNIEEVRNTEQWRNYVLFLDEMGYAGKADIDNVKNKITAEFVTGRPMRTNDNVQYRQNATFIGCSNKELDQLIRDETGNRRFVALRFSSNPDWTKIADLDARLLWCSVGEKGEDPTKVIADQLVAAQALVREKSAVEQWLDHHTVAAGLHGQKQPASELYKTYKLWAETYSPGRIMDVAMWGKEFTRLINAGQVQDWQKRVIAGRAVYVYN